MMSGGLWKDQSMAKRPLHLIEPAARDLRNGMLRKVPGSRSHAGDAVRGKWLIRAAVGTASSDAGNGQTVERMQAANGAAVAAAQTSIKADGEARASHVVPGGRRQVHGGQGT